MGWGNCGKDTKGRTIGYNFEAICDHPGCDEKIDRGLAYACGGMHGDASGEGGLDCEGYFCYEHLVHIIVGGSEMANPKRLSVQLCIGCANEAAKSKGKVDE